MAKLSNNQIAEAIVLHIEEKQGGNYKDEVSFLAKKRLLSKSDVILSMVEKIINKKEDRIVATVFSAQQLEEKKKIDLIHGLKHRYSARDIDIREKINKDLIGGIKIEIEDEILDMTLKGRLNKLQAHLVK